MVAMHQNALGNSEVAREVRSASLRLVALLILFANLYFGDDQAGIVTHFSVSVAYFVVSAVSIIIAVLKPRYHHARVAFVLLDASLVVALFYEHILANPVTTNHDLTTSSLVIAFILLNHVAFTLDRRLIAAFASLVITSWVLMLAIMALRHETAGFGTLAGNFFNRDFVLTMSFAFTALVVFLLVRDHETTRTEALKIEERRLNLSRFFSPGVVSDLQEASAVLDLERRDAAIMFVDIREFTSYSEVAAGPQLTRVLVEYRRLVAGTVFAYEGTVDKFIGDGVMAVFGQPKPRQGDAQRALNCASELAQTLEEWRLRTIASGGPNLRTGIGLHYGPVIGGVIESGFHDEFTVFGDAVNVAQRLESLSKSLSASLVISASALQVANDRMAARGWHHRKQVTLPGRKEPLDIAFLRQSENIAPRVSAG
jgi:adenylate cyclase